MKCMILVLTCSDYIEAMKIAADDWGYLPIYAGMVFNLHSKNVSVKGTGTLRNWSQAMDTITVK